MAKAEKPDAMAKPDNGQATAVEGPELDSAATMRKRSLRSWKGQDMALSESKQEMPSTSRNDRSTTTECSNDTLESGPPHAKSLPEEADPQLSSASSDAAQPLGELSLRETTLLELDDLTTALEEVGAPSDASTFGDSLYDAYDSLSVVDHLSFNDLREARLARVGLTSGMLSDASTVADDETEFASLSSYCMTEMPFAEEHVESQVYSLKEGMSAVHIDRMNKLDDADAPVFPLCCRFL